MSTGRPKERSMLSSSHDSKQFSTVSPSHSVHTGGSFSSSFPGEAFHQSYMSKPRPLAVDLTHNTDAVSMPDNRRLSLLPSHSKSPANHSSDRHGILMNRERMHLGGYGDALTMPRVHQEKRGATLQNDATMPSPKKPRYDGRFATTSNVPIALAQPLRIDTGLDSIKIKVEPPGGYHPETEAISPTLPTESHDSKSDIVHSINEVDREINLIENQIQQLHKTQSQLEAEAAKPKGDIVEEESNNESSKPLTIAQIVYSGNRKLAHRSHNVLHGLGTPTELPLFHQPCDTDVFNDNVRHFQHFRPVLELHFKKKALERKKTESEFANIYESSVTSWLKKVDTKTLKKNIKDMKTREYFEKVFPEIKKSREDKERITSRVGARGVGGAYARTEAEFEQIIDGINEQEEEDKKMRAYAIIPPMLGQTNKALKFTNRNGLIQEPMSEYKKHKLSTNWSNEEKEIFKEKYLDRPKQFGQIADLLEKKNLNDCVLHYYMSKKTEHFKQLLKKHGKRPPRRPQMRPGIRNSNEGQIVGGAVDANAISVTKNAPSDEEDVVKVTRSAVGDSKLSCCACGVKIESYSVSHRFDITMCAQFGLDEQNCSPEQRICATCFKIRRRQNKTCPIPSCTTPRRRICHLPIKWDDIPTEIRDRIMRELHMEEKVSRCCSSCYDKIADLLDAEDNVASSGVRDGSGFVTKWTDENINALKEGIRRYGKNWHEISSLFTNKSEEQCKMYFYRNKRKQGLGILYNEFRKSKAKDLGYEPEQSEEDDDDNLEDNDMSSDNEVVPADGLLPTSTHSRLSRGQLNTSNTLPVADTKPSLLNNPTSNDKLVNGECKFEDMDTGKPIIKVEKVDYDSSATASADEDTAQPNPMHLYTNRKLLDAVSNPMTKQVMSILKQEPELWSNPDGMMRDAYSRTNLTDAKPHGREINKPTTSVKQLIDLAIEDALNEDNATAVSLSRPSVINQCHPVSSKATNPTGNHSNHSQSSKMDLRQHVSPTSYNIGSMTAISRGLSTPSRPSSRVKDDIIMAHQHAPNAPYSSHPRDFSVSRNVHKNSHSSTLHGNDVNQIRAPPPAHSHHLTSSQLEIRSSGDRKSPAVASSVKSYSEPAYPAYDSKAALSNNRMSPHVRPPIGHPPPLISSGMSSQPSTTQLMSHKKEGSHAGGSILQGTSATHGPPPPSGGSISHGTPRSQPETKSFSSSTASRAEERVSRSPRTQQPVHPSVPMSNQLQYDRLMAEQYNMYLHYEALKRGGMVPFTNVPLNASMHEQLQTKSVLQNDFLTAKQMSSNSVSLPLATAAAYTSALDKEKAGKASPRPTNPLMTANPGLPANLLEQQQAMMMLMNSQGLMLPHMYNADRQRLLAAQSQSASMPLSAVNKEDASRTWSSHLAAAAQHSQASHKSGPEQLRQLKPSIMQGMIPKTVENLHKQGAPLSPYMKKTSKTRYEKDLEEMNMRSQSEHRTRSDSERTLTDTETNQSTPVSFSGGNRLQPSDYTSISRSPSTGSRSDNFMTKPQQHSGYKSLVPGGMMDGPMRGHRKSADGYKDKLYNRSPYNKSDDLMPAEFRDQRKSIFEQDRKLSEMMKAEAEKQTERERYSRPTDLSRSSAAAAAKSKSEDGYSSMRLAEVSKGIEKRHFPKDASALFSSSFEKDAQQHISGSSNICTSDTGLTTANIIDAIITKQINNESNADKPLPPTSRQHTSVIVPPKKQRPIPHSRSDTDITSYNHQQQKMGDVSSTSSTPPVSAMSTLNPTRPLGQITLADKINEIITNDYKLKSTDSQDPGGNVDHRSDGGNRVAVTSGSAGTPQPYRVEDVEPISPPNNDQSKNRYAGTQSNLVGGTKGNPAAKKHAGIRSLLGADNVSNDSPTSSSTKSQSLEQTAGMSLMDRLKNNIEDAINQHDSDLHAEAKKSQMHQSSGPGLSNASFHHDKSDEKLDESSSREKEATGNKKRSLEAMLASNSKRPALSPSRAKSPEEVELYNVSHSDRVQHPLSPYQPQAGSNANLNRVFAGPNNPYQYPNSSSYRPPYFPPTGVPYSVNNVFPTSMPNDYPAIPKIAQPSPIKASPLPSAGTGQSYLQHNSRSVAPSFNYSQSISTSRSSSTDKADGELVIDEGSNQSSNSLDMSSRVQPDGVQSQSPNLFSLPNIGSNKSRILSSNAMGNSPSNPTSLPNTSRGLSGSTSMNNRMSPIASVPGNRMSPGTSAHSTNNRNSPLQPNRQSPLQANRQSPLVTRQSPLDNTARSPVTSNNRSPVSPRAPVHMNSNTDMSRHSSLSENDIPNSMMQKSLEAARSLNSLVTAPNRPLLSDQYDTLSDDES